MPRPSVSDPEFAAYFENIVETSKTRREAMNRLGYSTPTTIYRHLKRLGIPRPKEWSRKPGVSLHRQRLIPGVLIPSIESRAWVGALIQGEGCIQCRYQKRMQSTGLQLDTSMVDPAPIRELAKNYGLPAPSKPTRNHEWKPLWRKNIAGLRALRILHEILPFLFGDKRREAEKAIDFFSADGYHFGRFGNLDIWSPDEFPLRSKRRGSPTPNFREDEL